MRDGNILHALGPVVAFERLNRNVLKRKIVRVVVIELYQATSIPSTGTQFPVDR